MNAIKDIRKVKDLKGKKILLRLDLNVPLKNGKVADGFRIKRAIPAVVYLKKKGAKVIIISHIGRDKKETLKPIASYINKITKVSFSKDTIGKGAVKSIEKMKNGEAIILENLRKHDGEVSNKMEFARELAKLGDIYVNDAFANSHRKHASMVQLPKLLPAYANSLLIEEIYKLKTVFNPPSPFLFILGGAKPRTKIPLIRKYAKTADFIFIGGALMNSFYKELGYNIGRSLVVDTGINISSIVHNKKIILPVDVVVKGKRGTETKAPDSLVSSDKIMDIGSQSVKILNGYIKKSKFILFNGPLGNYEEGFGSSTKETLKTILNSKTKSIIGGGDTAFLACCFPKNKNFSFISTGGGAMLEFLAKGTLPAIEALKKSNKMKRTKN